MKFSRSKKVAKRTNEISWKKLAQEVRKVLWGTMNFFRGRPKCFGNDVFSLGEGQSALGRRVDSPRNNVFSLGKGPSSPWNNHVLNCFVITTISCWFLYRLANYHWKGLNEGYVQVCDWKCFNRNSYEKDKITQNLKHICSLGHMVGPKE